MKKVISYFKSVISPASKNLKRIQKDLLTLEKEMREISQMDNKVLAIIRLFQVISPLQDKGGFSQTIFKLQEKNYGQIDKIISALESLQKHIAHAGRSEFGINRTKRDEEITAAKVFLGDVFGIWTKPASYWLQNQTKLEQEDSGANPKEGCGREFISVWYCINDYQAKTFVDSHTKGILEQISILKTAA